MTANTSEADESRRVIRLLERSIIKRDVAVNRLRSVMSLAERSMKDPEESPHLLEAVEDLDNLWSKFEVEDEAILDHLLSLERSSEYSAKLSAEMRELVTFCRSVTRRYREFEQSSSNMLVCSGSYVSVISNKSSTIPAVQQTTVPDTSLPTVSSSQVSISRLPEIPLPSFYGDIFQCPSFRDKF